MKKEKIVFSKQISIPSIPSQYSHSHQVNEPIFYLHMFADDVRSLIIPYDWDEENSPAYSIQLFRETPDLNRIVVHTFSFYQQFSHQQLKSVVAEFIRDIAFHVVYRGNLFFEVLEGQFKSDGTKISVPTPIPGKVISVGNFVLQFVPPSDRNKLRKTVVWIPTSKVWKIRIPASLGGNWQLSKLQRGMKTASEFVPKDLKTKEWTKDEDVLPRINQYDLIRKDLLAQATAPWGWNARDTWKMKALEYYRVYRELHFAKTLALLREYILVEMNFFLKRVQVPTEITMTGLPSSVEIDDLIDKLHAGQVSFAHALDFIGLR